MRRLFNVCVRVFCAPNATILLVYIPAKITMSFIWKDDFIFSASSVRWSQAHLSKRKRIGWSIGFNSWIKLIAGALIEAKTHWMVNWLQLLNQLNFYGVTPRCLSKNRFNDVSDMSNCWERRWIDVDGFTHTFCHSSNILGCTHYFFLFMLWFINEDARFFHFFHKITIIRRWRCFSSSKIRKQFSHTFCNITMIIEVMWQYFPALFKRIHSVYHIHSGEV